ncbi:MAG: site-specific integrase [Bacteroidales bacterium]|nr:site-specific integrase [Bacteroidales bacterium]
MKISNKDRQITAKVKLPRVITSLDTSYTNKDEKHPIYLLVYLQGKRVRFHTGINVSKTEWDDSKKLIIKSHPDAGDYNLIISQARAKISNILVKYRLHDKEVSPSLLKEEYERPSTAFDFIEWLERAIEERRGEVTDTSIRQFRGHMLKLKEYRKTLSFSELNEDFFHGFNRYMKTTLKNHQNTRFNTLKTLRTFINIAKRKGIVEYNPLDRMPTKRVQTDRVFLSEEEFEKLLELYRHQSLPEKYQRTLRQFLFSCFTGLRISDIPRIRMEDIIANTLILIPLKTKNTAAKTIRIPLPAPAIELIKDESPNRLQGPIFNCFSEQKMREFLKDILKVAKIYKNANFHSGRHTFATIFLRRSKNLAALQRLLGHSNINQTMVYAHILTEDIETEMKVFDEF